MTRRSIILVACGVLTVLVGIAVALLSSDQSAPVSSTTVEVDADAGADDEAASGAPVADAPAGSRPDVPEGTEAVAIEAPFVAGGAGFVAAGDQVNVFALVDEPTPGTVMVLSDVTVLEVSAAGTSSSSSSTGSGTTGSPKQVTFVLAVPVDQVEAVVRAAGFNRLYVTIPAEGNPQRPTAVVGAVDAGEVAP